MVPDSCQVGIAIGLNDRQPLPTKC
ncbi:uncharacterized protein METZ01_LOCUS109874 [marine metagenome]|uniref:Uncharacterized protein n=1 Tax=marine metagenome TaxID=408172 RepID=A0A381WX61_9ZZZZ